MKIDLILLSLRSLLGASAATPDLILFNGKVFTADAANPNAEALAIRGERIVSVGTAKRRTTLSSNSDTAGFPNMNTIKSSLIALSLVAAGQHAFAQSVAGPASSMLLPALAATRPVPVAEPAEVFSLSLQGGGLARTVGTNEILTFAHTNGAKLVLQFTLIEGTNIAYRWRSQSSPEAPIVTGESTLSEPRQWASSLATTNSEVVFKGGPIPFRVLNAGGMRVVWVPRDALDRWRRANGYGRAENRGQDTSRVSLFISGGLVSLGDYRGGEGFDALLDTVPIEAYQPPSLYSPGGAANH